MSHAEADTGEASGVNVGRRIGNVYLRQSEEEKPAAVEDDGALSGEDLVQSSQRPRNVELPRRVMIPGGGPRELFQPACKLVGAKAAGLDPVPVSPLDNP